MKFSKLMRFAAVGITISVYSTVAANEKGYVTFTFDDAPETTYTDAYPILKEYGYPATVYVNTKHIGEPWWYIKWDQLKELQKNGWEVGSHAHEHDRLTDLSREALISSLKVSVEILEDKGFTPTSFASPFGDFNENVIREAKKHFKSHRKAWGEPNGVHDPASFDPYEISVLELDHRTSFAVVEEVLKKARKKGRWVVFLAHEIVEDPGKWQISPEIFKEIVQSVKREGLAVRTVYGMVNARSQRDR